MDDCLGSSDANLLEPWVYVGCEELKIPESQAGQQRALPVMVTTANDAGGCAQPPADLGSSKQVNEPTLGQPEHASSCGSATADVDMMSRDSAQMLLSPDGARGSPDCLSTYCTQPGDGKLKKPKQPKQPKQRAE
jgi:hypothetical protein